MANKGAGIPRPKHGETERQYLDVAIGAVALGDGIRTHAEIAAIITDAEGQRISRSAVWYTERRICRKLGAFLRELTEAEAREDAA